MWIRPAETRPDKMTNGVDKTNHREESIDRWSPRHDRPISQQERERKTTERERQNGSGAVKSCRSAHPRLNDVVYVVDVVDAHGKTEGNKKEWKEKRKKKERKRRRPYVTHQRPSCNAVTSIKVRRTMAPLPVDIESYSFSDQSRKSGRRPISLDMKLFLLLLFSYQNYYFLMIL